MKKKYKTLMLIWIAFYLSVHIHAQWIQSSLPSSYMVTDILQSNSYVYVATSGNGILKTQNFTDWTPSGSGIGTNTIYEITSAIEQGSFISFYAATDAGAFRSTMLGYSWVAINNGITNQNLSTIYADGTYLFAGAHGAAYRSENFGQSWTPMTIGTSNQTVSCFFRNGTDLLAGLIGMGEYLYRSTDNGLTWQPYGTGLYELQQINKLGDELFAISGTVMYHSLDNGATWSLVGPGLVPGMYISDLFPFEDYLFVATLAGGYVQHTDSTNFRLITAGMPLGGSMLSAVSVNEEWVIFGTINAGLWYATPEILTDVKENPLDIRDIAISPNPASDQVLINLTTHSTIAMEVSLINHFGKLMRQKSFGNLQPGVHSLPIVLNDLPPGAYFLTITAGHQRKSLPLVHILK
jgi:hypothetical protein